MTKIIVNEIQSKSKEIIRIRVEINEIENWKTIEKMKGKKAGSLR